MSLLQGGNKTLRDQDTSVPLKWSRSVLTVRVWSRSDLRHFWTIPELSDSELWRSFQLVQCSTGQPTVMSRTRVSSGPVVVFSWGIQKLTKSNESTQITQLTAEAARPLTISNPGFFQTENRRNSDIFHTRKPGFIVAFKFGFSGLKWAVIASENASIASSTECSRDTQWLVLSPLVIIQCRSVSRRFGTTPKVSGQFGYGPEVSGDTSGPYPNCLGTKVSVKPARTYVRVWENTKRQWKR